ncbi:MAG: sugar-binding transcriptional regulator, partial [Deinococcota bacterium]
MTQPTTDDIQLLLQIAQAYYDQGLTQLQISRKLGTSRSTVSRALQTARDIGLVEITIHHDWLNYNQLEQQLKAKFGLKQVSILPAGHADVLDELGKLAATSLDTYICDGMILGMSYGRSLAATIKYIRPQPKQNISVVQLIGALGSHNPLIEGLDLSRNLANKYGGSYRYLYAPLLVEDRRTRDLLTGENLVQDVLEIGKQADVALLGIGALAANVSSLIWTGYLNQKELTKLQQQGAAGHMCAQFYNDDGSVMDIPFNRRTISIGLDALKQIDTVIVVAGTKEKSRAILGALRGGYIDVLITDEAAAQGIMERL